LIQRGLLDPAAITRGEFAVEEVEFHNRGFRIYRPAEEPLYVKQLREFDQPNVSCLKREAAFVAAAAETDSVPWLSSRIPSFVDFDARHHAVTVELLSETENLHETMERVVAIPESVSRGLGQLIGAFHSQECDELLASISRELCPGKPPWILSFHLDQGRGSLSPANDQLLALLQRDEVFTSNLDELRSSWRPESLMHGDLKWNNVLIREKESVPDWYVIDWEMVDRGDPRWDLGTLIQCWWYFWILSTPLEQLSNLDDLLTRRYSAFDETKGSLDVLWAGYLSAVGISDSSVHQTLHLVARFAAARMLQTVYELLQHEESLSLSAQVMIEMSRRILETPESLSEFLPRFEV
jgi:tRNA A-37 threonylcarbamoyl transferase component Bud32